MNIKSFICSFSEKFSFTEKLYNGISRKIQYIRDWKNIKYPIIKATRKNPNIAFLLFTPNHGNLGDTAIAVSQKKLLEESGIEFIEFNIQKCIFFIQRNWIRILNGHPIYFNGGGNLGTLWFGLEEFFRETITKCPKSKILFFPNTIYYEDTEFGKTELENAKKIYNSHKSITIYARENISYENYKNVFNDVKLAPDMVMYLNFSDENNNIRNGCVLCLRHDREKTLKDDDLNLIVSFANSNFKNVSYTDTCIDHNVDADHRELELNKKLNEFKNAQLVITDRLHGMVFCAITGTPCILINSKSPKIMGCYKWLENLPYIKFCDNLQEIENVYKKIPTGSFVYDNSHLLPLYTKLKTNLIDIYNP